LAYFNIAAGGSAGGHRWLLDSNLDWGQDDRRLARWLAREPDWEVNPNLQPARPGRFLVNANSLHNLQRRSERPYDWLRDWEPNRRVGAAWHSYEITLADFERRAAARPDDPLACIAYAEAVAATGDSMLAARAFARALQRFGTDPRVAARTSRWAAGRGDFAIASRALAGAARAAGRADVELQLAAERLRLESKIHAANSDSAAGQAALAYGIFLSEVGEGEAALPWLDRAAAALPGDVEAQRAPAVARVRRAQFAPARRHLEASPLRADLEAEIALCRNYEEWETAVGRGTTVPRTALHELGRIQFDAGELDAAAASFLAILRDHPDDAQALAYLGEAQVRSKLRVASGRIAPRRVR
jgi:tetratricopeptide (TPR) repeat protein